MRARYNWQMQTARCTRGRHSFRTLSFIPDIPVRAQSLCTGARPCAIGTSRGFTGALPTCARVHCSRVRSKMVKHGRARVHKSFAHRAARARRPARSGRMGAGEGVRHGNGGRTTWHDSHKRGLATRTPVEQRVSSPMLVTTDGADRGRGLLVTGIVYV